MNVIYLSPHFPENYIAFVAALYHRGVQVLGIADLPFDHLPEQLKGVLTDYYQVDNMENYEELFRAVAFFSFKYGKIDHLDSLNEYWLFTEAKLRTDFNIPGIQNDTIADMKYKSRMKERFKKAGIRVAEGKVIDDIDSAREFISKTGFPVVAKPDIGVGAVNTYKISDEEWLERFFQNKPPEPYIFEEFISGRIETFDGLTDKFGNLVYCTGHVYSDGVMEVVNNDRHVYYYSFREIPADVEEMGMKIFREFNLKGRFFHFEFFRTYEGSLIALEVNMRPPGGYTTDMFNFGSDIDIYEQWANMVTMNTFGSDFYRKYHVAYVGRKWRFNYKYSTQQIEEMLGQKLVFHNYISGIFSLAMGNYGYIIRHQDLDELLKCVNLVHELNE
ncbi:MAG: ATP-grasp domain-containing protein [Deltaproteobacteria bacterium]